MLKPFGIYLISMWAVLTIAAIGLNLTLGYAGQVSLAQGAFVGIGAYTVALLTPGRLSVRAGVRRRRACSCFAIGWMLGYPALRVQHHYLAFVTLAFTTLGVPGAAQRGMADRRHLRHQRHRAPGILRLVDRKAADHFYFFCLGTLAFCRSRPGGCCARPGAAPSSRCAKIRSAPLSLGVDTRRYTLMAFAIGSSLGGLAGALYAPLVQFIEPGSFALGLSFNLLLMVIVGGSGYFFGPFVGALVAVLLPEWMRIAEGYYLIVYAALVMVMMAFCPSGILGSASTRRRKRFRARQSCGAGAARRREPRS